MSAAYFQFFLINHIADTSILFLVRQKMFPEKGALRVIAGGWISSAAYLIWSYVHGIPVNWFWVALAVLLVLLLLKYIFQIRSTALLIQTLSAALIYAFVLGGITFQIRRILPDPFPLKNLSAVMFSAFLCTVFHPALIKKERIIRKREDNLYDVEIKRGKKAVKCTGLYDSGNLLTSQITGEGICVITEKEGEGLLSKKEKKYDPASDLFSGCEIYPIQFHSIGKRNGYMTGVLADHIIISKNKEILVDKKGMIGICKGIISKDERFSVLLPEDIFS